MISRTLTDDAYCPVSELDGKLVAMNIEGSQIANLHLPSWFRSLLDRGYAKIGNWEIVIQKKGSQNESS